MDNVKADRRPRYLNLVQIRLPVAGMMSICHRISGALMFLFLPFLVYLLHLASSGEQGFSQAQQLLALPLVQLVLLVMTWSVFHHLFAGIRYLLIDIDLGVERRTARMTAGLVIVSGLVATLLVALL